MSDPAQKQDEPEFKFRSGTFSAVKASGQEGSDNKGLQFKQIQRDGVQFGIIEGYIATWDEDRGDWMYRDQFMPGAFAESIADLKRRNRPLRMLKQHREVIGGFPAEFLREDDRGLFGIGEINLGVQDGVEVYELAKQGVLSDFSIGFSAQEYTIIADESDDERELRQITRAIAWEGSVVDEPMNPQANITSVKEKDGMKTHDIEDVKEWGPREVEQALKKSGIFSQKAAKYLAGQMKASIKQEDEDEDEDDKRGDDEDTRKSLNSMLSELKSLTDSLKKA